jgi:hypothetical protein
MHPHLENPDFEPSETPTADRWHKTPPKIVGLGDYGGTPTNLDGS